MMFLILHMVQHSYKVVEPSMNGFSSLIENTWKHPPMEHFQIWPWKFTQNTIFSNN